MSQSAGPTVLTGPGQGVIQDLYGREWQINDDGSVVVGTTVDTDPQPVVTLTLISGAVWRKTRGDLCWSSKRHPSDPWSPPTPVSPVPGDVATDSEVVAEFSQGTRSILAAIANAREDFDNWTALPPPSPSPERIMEAISALQAEADTLETASAAAAGRTTLTALLGQVLAGQSQASAAATSNQNVLVATLNQIIAAQAANQAALVAPLDQVLNAVTSNSNQAVVVDLLDEILASVSGATSPLPAIATLQKDFTNLTVTLNAIASGISAKLAQILELDDPTANAAMMAEIATILGDVEQILAIVKSEVPPTARLNADFSHATHTIQKVPPAGGSAQ